MLNDLILRGKRKSARLFIPTDLQKLAGPKEIVKSLGSGDRKHAKILLRRIQHIAERLYFYARVGMIDKGKLVARLLNYIEYSLRDWAENKDYLKEQEIDLSAYLTAPHSFLYKPAWKCDFCLLCTWKG